MLKEFKAFILTGNVIELAVAVIIAGAIKEVISVFTTKVIMPIVGHFTGGVDFSDLMYVLSEAVVDADGNVVTPMNAVMYGEWINSIINLVLVGFVLFVIIKAYNKSKKKKEEETPAPSGPSQEDLLTEIRDLLKK